MCFRERDCQPWMMILVGRKGLKFLKASASNGIDAMMGSSGLSLWDQVRNKSCNSTTSLFFKGDIFCFTHRELSSNFTSSAAILSASASSSSFQGKSTPDSRAGTSSAAVSDYQPRSFRENSRAQLHTSVTKGKIWEETANETTGNKRIINVRGTKNTPFFSDESGRKLGNADGFPCHINLMTRKISSCSPDLG